MDSVTKSFAFKLAQKKPANTKWKAREGVSVAGCTHVWEGIYWYGPIWNRDGQAEC